MKRFVACLCVFLLPAGVTVCRGDEPKSHRDNAAIEKVVGDSMEAARKLDWKKYAELVHPESLQDYKNMWVPVLQAATNKRPEEQADLLSAFHKAMDLKTLVSLKPKEFFVSSMKGMAAQLRKLNTNPLQGDEKIIGTVRDGDRQAYVVVRAHSKLPGAEMTRVEVVALKRSGTEWKLMLPDSVRIMAEMFKRTGQDEQKSGPVQDRADPDKEDAAKQAIKKLPAVSTAGIPSGTWAVVSSEVAGKPSKLPPEGSLFTFVDGKVTMGPKKKEGKLYATFKADPKKDPKEIDFVQEMNKRKLIGHGIYRLEKDRLIICVGTASGSSDDPVLEGKRPTEFKSGPDNQVLSLKRSGD